MTSGRSLGRLAGAIGPNSDAATTMICPHAFNRGGRRVRSSLDTPHE
jgi:hypothetical protein